MIVCGRIESITPDESSRDRRKSYYYDQREWIIAPNIRVPFIVECIDQRFATAHLLLPIRHETSPE